MHKLLVLMLLCSLTTSTDAVYRVFDGFYPAGYGDLGSLPIDTDLNLVMTCSKSISNGFSLYKGATPTTLVVQSTATSSAFVVQITHRTVEANHYWLKNAESNYYKDCLVRVEVGGNFVKDVRLTQYYQATGAVHELSLPGPCLLKIVYSGPALQGIYLYS